jgi:protein SCO1/2
MKVTSRAWAVAAVAASVALLGPLVGCGGDAAESTTTAAQDDGQLSGYTREPTPSVAQVSLPLTGGAGDLPAAAEPGGLRVVYFGYTSCPDVCPTTMSDLKRALADLSPDERDRVEVVMVTIDPARDVDEKLDAYVQTFIADGHASRIADPAALAAAAGAFGASYSVDTADDGEIEVSHSADLYVVDDTGDIILQWPFGTSQADIAADLSDLLADRASA